MSDPVYSSPRPNTYYARCLRDPLRFLHVRWNGMRNRVRGASAQTIHPHLHGLPIIDEPTFVSWSMADGSPFPVLYAAWRDAAFLPALAPSVDRRDATKGYTLDNMQWLTWRENNSKGGRDVARLYPRKAGTYYDRLTPEQRRARSARAREREHARRNS